MSTARKLLRRYLKPYVADEFFRVVVKPADLHTDRSLDQLETEEPSLLNFIQNEPKLANLLSAHSAATAVTIMRGNQYRLSIEDTVSRLDSLTYRLVATVIMETTMRTRREDLRYKEPVDE